jgi:SAM-dependent methyltransferase
MTNQFDAREYWEKRLSGRFDLRGVGDISLPESYNRWLYRVRRHVFDVATRHLTRDREIDVLDVGSGTGFYIEQWLERRPQRLVGCDLTDAAVTRLATRFPQVEFTRCDIGVAVPSSLSRGAFDVVTAMDVLFHITDDRRYHAAFTNFRSLVKPGGMLMFSDNLMAQPRATDHQVCRTEGRIRAAVEANGFAVERIMPMFVFMNNPVRSQSGVLRKHFAVVARMARRSESWGNAIGCALFLPEIVGVTALRRGPSTEVVLCRRTG